MHPFPKGAAMTRPLRVLSLYEGFFAGGARILHTDVIAALHAAGDQEHRVLSLASAAVRESTSQPMQEDPRYLRLSREDIEVVTLGRTAGAVPPDPSSFTDVELRVAADAIAEADVVLSLKEQPLGLLLALQDRGWMPDVPVAACLHRSDPAHSGPALSWLGAASVSGLVTSTISCAESTSDAYAGAGVVPDDRFVIDNGIDLARFHPGTAEERREIRRSLSIPPRAPVVVFAARFDAMKDPGLFLRAVAAHSERRPGTHYVLCGAGMTWANEAFRELVDATGIGTAVRLHALGIRDDMPRIHRIASIVALTSAFGEASPLCLLEGAASGATPVTTDVGDAARSVAGIGHVTPHDPREIAGVWDRVLADRRRHRRAALAARPRLSRERMIEEYRTVIERMLPAREAAA